MTQASQNLLKEFNRQMQKRGFSVSNKYPMKGSKFIYIIVTDINDKLAFKVGSPCVEVNIETKKVYNHDIEISHGYIKEVLEAMKRGKAKFLTSDK